MSGKNSIVLFFAQAARAFTFFYSLRFPQKRDRLCDRFAKYNETKIKVIEK